MYGMKECTNQVFLLCRWRSLTSSLEPVYSSPNRSVIVWSPNYQYHLWKCLPNCSSLFPLHLLRLVLLPEIEIFERLSSILSISCTDPGLYTKLVDWFGKTGLNWYFYCLEPMQKNPFNSMEQVKKTNSLHISPSLSVRPSLWPQLALPMIQVVVLWWVYSCGIDGYASGPSRILVVR